MDQFRRAHGANTMSATTATIAIIRTLTGRSIPRAATDEQDPCQGEPRGLVACQGSQTQQDADPEQTRVAETAVMRLAKHARHQQAGAQHEGRERHRRIGEGRVQDERQIDRRGETRPEGDGPGAHGRHAALRGDIGREPPGEHRHRRADEDARDLRGLERRAEDEHRDRREERRERHPDLERRSREDRAVACRSSTAHPTRARGPRPDSAPRRRSRRCPPAWGTRPDRRTRRVPRERPRTGRGPTATTRALMPRAPRDRQPGEGATPR